MFWKIPSLSIALAGGRDEDDGGEDEGGRRSTQRAHAGFLSGSMGVGHADVTPRAAIEIAGKHQ